MKMRAMNKKMMNKKVMKKVMLEKKNFAKAAATVLSLCMIAGGSILSAIPGMSVRQAKAAQTVISVEKAKKIAFSDAKTKESKVKNLRVEKDGKTYEIEFIKGSFRYEYDVNGVSGKVKNLDKKRVSLSKSDRKKKVSKNKAKKIAFKSAGVKKSKTRRLKVKLYKTRKGYRYYKVRFYVGSKEYEYEIDGYTGTILEYDIDEENDYDDYDDDDDDDDDDDEED